MKTCSISVLARMFGLSRSTLLYYDRIGLLSASDRTASGYRVYTARDRQRLERICHFREAGLTLEEIRTLLSSRGNPCAKVLEKRIAETSASITDLKNKQRLLARMLKRTSGGVPPFVDKAMWIEMLRAAGMNKDGMNRWHAEFEQRAPSAHQEFLASLGLSKKEILQIRQWSKTAWPREVDAE